MEAVVALSALEPFNPDPVCSSSSCLGRGLNRLRGELNRDVLDGLQLSHVSNTKFALVLYTDRHLSDPNRTISQIFISFDENCLSK